MVQDDELWLAIRTWPDKQIAWMRISMHKPILKYHKVKTLGNQLRQVSKVYSLFVDLAHMSYRCSCLKRHHKNPGFGKLIVNFRNGHVWVVLENSFATIAIGCLDYIIKFSWQLFVHLFGKPTIFEFWEKVGCSV